MTRTAIIPATERKLKNRVSVGFAIKNALTFAHRSLIKMFRTPESFMDVALMPIMFTLLFTYLFGGAIAGDIASYLPIIVPGILIQTYLTNCGVAGMQVREDMDKSTTNRFISMPIARTAPIAGILIAEWVRFAIGGIIVFATGYVIGYRPEAGILAVIGSILLMMLIAWCLCWLFTFVAISVKSISTASATTIMIMFPLVFFSNAFVPTETLPSFLQFFVNHINPVTKAVNAVRQILAHGTIGTDFWLALFGALVILAVFIPLTLLAYKRKV